MRRVAIQIHLWLGLTVGLLWALQGLSGAWLVFHREVERIGVVVPVGPMASLDTIIANAQAARPGEVVRVSIADAGGRLLNVDYGGKGEGVTAEATTAQIVRVDPGPVEHFNQTLYHFHEELLSGERGRLIIGISGLLLLTASLLGVWIGWPRRGGWRVAFSPARWTTLKTRLYGWHRAAGLLACVALAMAALSGATMIWGKELRGALKDSAIYAAPYQPKPVAALIPPIVTPGAAWQTAQVQFPDASFVRLTMPTAKSPVYHFRLLQRGELRTWSGTTGVWIDPADGRVLGTYDAVRAPVANRLLDAAFALHSGEAAGLPGRILILLAGLSLPVFYVTGVLAWWRKRRRAAPPAYAGLRNATSV